MARGFQPALSQMDQMALGLYFARAPKLIERHGRAMEWRLSSNHHVTVHDGLILDGKRVERTAELRHREQQRRFESFSMPGFDERADRVEVTAGH